MAAFKRVLRTCVAALTASSSFECVSLACTIGDQKDATDGSCASNLANDLDMDEDGNFFKESSLLKKKIKILKKITEIGSKCTIFVKISSKFQILF